MNARDSFKSDLEFVRRLRSLRADRRELKSAKRPARALLTLSERRRIFAKTDGRCHICGGEITGRWQADHVFSHALGGQHSLDNYLPAHDICNNYRWFYGSEEFQWILKLGVWLRTQIENETAVGNKAAQAFCAHERIRSIRCRKAKRN
ncbi:MAG: HNH endonuclease [Terriglobales bacterium]